ncbi:hypothetical protein D3C85_393110 [compost metagenome]
MALRALADVGRAGVDADDQVGPRRVQGVEGVDGVGAAIVIPAILANHEADLAAGDLQGARAGRTRLEMAALVEDAVSGQQLLVVFGDDAPVAHRQQGVVQGLADAGVGPRRADDGDQCRPAGGRLQHGVERLLHAVQEGGILEQVARVIRAQRQFGADEQVRAFLAGALHARDDGGDISVEVAHGGIHLGEGDGQHGDLSVGCA